MLSQHITTKAQYMKNNSRNAGIIVFQIWRLSGKHTDLRTHILSSVQTVTKIWRFQQREWVSGHSRAPPRGPEAPGHANACCCTSTHVGAGEQCVLSKPGVHCEQDPSPPVWGRSTGDGWDVPPHGVPITRADLRPAAGTICS